MDPVECLVPSSGEGSRTLTHDPAGGCFLGLPGLHQLLGKLPKLICILSGVEGPVELFDLKLLLCAELNTAVHRDLQLGVTARYGLVSNDLLRITRLWLLVSTRALAICYWS